MPELPDSLLRLITCVDYHRRLALLAESDADDGAEVVALSEFIAIDDHTAEVGLVVRDDWQRQGLGTALATRTLLAAEVRGFDQFVAQVLHENVGVMRLLDHVGVVISMRTRREVSEVTFVRRGRGEQRD
jgi:RimJ/RimL family protein N-acetyltransferase